MRFFHELLFFFINSFLLFHSHIKVIILYFFYSGDHQPTTIYPSFQEENFHPPYVVNVDPMSLPHPIHKYHLFIQIPLEFDHPRNLDEVGTYSKLSQILLS